MHPLYVKTPTIRSSALSEKIGRQVFLKLEMLQPSGSFKSRGIGNFCYKMWTQGVKKFIAASGGNAGLAVAISCKQLGAFAHIIIPMTTPLFMQDKLRREGSKVTVYGKDLDDAIVYAKRLAQEEKSVFVSPFDHPLIWEGHRSIVYEIFECGIKPGIIVLSVGGGGLLIGVLQGLKEIGWDDVPVMTVETEGAASFAASFEKGELVYLDEIKTIATSIGLKQVADEALILAKKHTIFPLIVKDEDAVLAALQFLDDEQFLLEPSCSIVTSPIYQNNDLLKEFDSALLIICGGRVINLHHLEKWKVQFHIS